MKVLRFLCVKCGKVIDWKAYRHVEVFTFRRMPDMGTIPGDLLELSMTVGLCKECYEELGLKQLKRKAGR